MFNHQSFFLSILWPFFHHALDWQDDRFQHVLFIIGCSSTCNEQNQFTCEEDPYCKLRRSECLQDLKDVVDDIKIGITEYYKHVKT